MNFGQHLLSIYTRYKLAFILGSILTVALLILGFLQNSLDKTATYLLTMTGCFLVSEFFFFTGKPRFEDWEIKHPKRELFVVIGSQIIVVFLLIYWFLLIDPQAVSREIKILTMVLRILFVFPVFFLIYFLAVEKYKLKTLGIIRFNHWYVGLALIILLGSVTYLTFPDGLQFKDALKTNGYLGFIVLGFLTAAIPEELTRVFLQTRLYGVLHSKSIAWFLASLVWALLHIPSFASQNGDYYEAFISALGILPIGLLWGYLNERYRSIVPSIIIHGTNLWGLHNVF